MAGRAVRFTSIAGETLRFVRLSGEEALSQPYLLHLELVSDDTEIDLLPLLGTPMAIGIEIEGGERWFHGLVSEISVDEIDGDTARLTASLRPQLWFLCRQSNCRIFQNKTTAEIVGDVLKDVSPVAWRLKGSYQPRVYCVQWNESDLAFIMRLLESDGITFYFLHEEDQHKMVLIDNSEDFKPWPSYEEVLFFPVGDAQREREHLDLWRGAAEVRSGSFAHTAYNFESPREDLMGLANRPQRHKLAKGEIYTWPGPHLQLDHGTSVAKLRLEAELARHALRYGSGPVAGLAAGHRFKLARHPRGEQNIDYLVTSIHHRIEDPNYASGAEEEFEIYRATVVAQPADRPFRPPLMTPRPRIEGVQTAVVTGPPGEEIHTDKYGRITVQFHWDREGKRDENSSCWIRVSQTWAGPGFGAIVIPRIGQEVVVAFLDGDPDQPLVTGVVYNGQAMPPYGLPGNKRQSGFKTRSSPGGGGSNELRFEDSKGSEEVYLHAQKDETIAVENDKTETVGHDETMTVVNNRTRNVGVNETVTIGANRVDTVVLNEARTVGVAQQQTVGAARNVTVGAAQAHEIGLNDSWAIGINRDVNIGRNDSLDVGNNRDVSIGDNDSLQVGKDGTIKIGDKLAISAGDEITITTGKAAIVMKKDGTITISGKDISVDASGKINMKASGNITQKGQKILQN